MLNKKLLDLYERAGFSHRADDKKWPNIYSVGTPMERLVELVTKECAEAAETTSRIFADGDGAKGSYAAAEAIRHYANTLLK